MPLPTRETSKSVQKLESRVVLCERTIEKMSSARSLTQKRGTGNKHNDYKLNNEKN